MTELGWPIVDNSRQHFCLHGGLKLVLLPAFHISVFKLHKQQHPFLLGTSLLLRSVVLQHSLPRLVLKVQHQSKLPIQLPEPGGSPMLLIGSCQLMTE